MDIITNSKRVLLHLHPKPDPDSVGSALATYHALRSLGKDVTVIKGDSELSPLFSFLPGYNEIVKKNFFEADLSQFDLFIIQDSGSPEMVSRKGEVIFPPHLRTIVIDHHITNTKFAEINFVDASYSSTCEYLYDLFLGWGIAIDANIAQCLYVGMYTDTGGFKYPSTTLRTMRIAARLAELYPQFPQLITDLENNNPPEKLYFDALALSNIEVVDGRIAVSSVSYAQLQEKGITRDHIENNIIASTLLAVAPWKIGISLIEKAPNEVSFSIRSKDGTDVSLIAVALGGGGHKPAAAALMKNCSIDEAKKKVLSVIHS